MSALGQKQTFAMQNGMSALHPKADMCSATRDVCFVPIADISQLGASFSFLGVNFLNELSGYRLLPASQYLRSS